MYTNEPISLNKTSKRKIPYGIIAVIALSVILLLSSFLSFKPKKNLKEGQICADKECLITRNYELQTKNTIQLALAKESMLNYERLYKSTRAQYNERVRIKNMLIAEGDAIVNSGLDLSDEQVFQLDFEMSSKIQPLIMSGVMTK